MTVQIEREGPTTYLRREGGAWKAVAKRGRGDYLVLSQCAKHGWLPGAAYRTEREALANARRIALDPELD